MSAGGDRGEGGDSGMAIIGGASRGDSGSDGLKGVEVFNCSKIC